MAHSSSNVTRYTPWLVKAGNNNTVKYFGKLVRSHGIRRMDRGGWSQNRDTVDDALYR